MGSVFEFVKEHSGVKEFLLTTNGLRVLLVPHRIGEVVAFMVHYNIGSRNEGVGHTGSAHFLEHLMFKGSKNFPKDTHAIDKIFARTGAHANATTWLDRTNYYEIISPEHLELFMKVEADRMCNAAFGDQDRREEMTVVRSELEIGDNDPSEVLRNVVIATAIQEHPYHHPIIGWRSDVEGVDTAKFREFYNTFYYPNNAMLILIGNMDEQKALDMIVEHFGAVAPSSLPIPQVHTVEPRQQGERRVIVKRPGGNGIIHFAWMSPGAAHADFAPLEVLAYILGVGKRNLLKQKFLDSGRVSGISIAHLPIRDPFPFYLGFSLLKMAGHRAIEREARAYLAMLQKQGVAQDQVKRAKGLAEADVWYGRDSLNRMLMDFSMAEGAGSWELYFTLMESIREVTLEDVMRVFREYLVSDNLTVGWYVPIKKEAV